jgi:hypothetical protein
MYPGADCEKTQAPPDPDTDNWRLKQVIDKERAAGQIGYAVNECNRPMSSAEILAELFKYHPPTPETLPKFAAINQAAKNFAEVVLQNCPGSSDRSAAIRLIRDARMTANAAVALNGLSL